MLQNHKSPEKTGSPKSRKEKLTKRQRIQAKISKNANVPINRLPVEILTMIIILARDPWAKKPRSWISFSRVCQYWRSAVLGHATFWKTIVFNRHITPTFLQEILKRSQSAPLEIFAQYLMPAVQALWDGLAADVDRVTTLHMTPYYPPQLSLPNLVSLFPSLENVIYDIDDTTNLTFETPTVYPNVKALQIYVERSASLTIPGRFPELRWLNLKYKSSIRLSLLLLKALQNLPNLQVLHLHPSSFALSPTSQITKTLLTFPELKVLITEQSIPVLIDAPKLTYLELAECQTIREMYRFCGFNFSEITSICFEIGDWNRIRITGYNNSKNNSSFHPSNFTSIFQPIPIFYPNKFQITLQDLEPLEGTPIGGPLTSFPLFAACLKKCTNVTEIIFGQTKSDDPFHMSHKQWQDFFSMVLRDATTVRELTVAWNCSFEELCEYLKDSTLFPHLEKLTYQNDVEREDQSCRQTLCELDPLQKLMKGRSGTGRKPLDIVLQDFFPVQPELIGLIEDLGIRLTQGTLNPEGESKCNYEDPEWDSENDGESESETESETSEIPL